MNVEQQRVSRCIAYIASVFFVSLASLSPLFAQTPPPVLPSRIQATPPAGLLRPGNTPTQTMPKAGDPSAAGAGSNYESAYTNKYGLKFASDAPLQAYLDAYTERTGQSFIVSPEVPEKIKNPYRIHSDVAFSTEEYLSIIEQILAWNGIALEPFGERFIKALPRKTIRQEGIPIVMDIPDKPHQEKNKVISQMIQFKSITATEAQKALEGFKRPDGLFQVFERTNSILVTDTQENINRMLEIVKFIDQPLLVLEEVFVRQIKFAKADDIKKRIDELVADSQKQTQKDEIKPNSSGSPGMTRSTTPAPSTSLLSSRILPPGLVRSQPQTTTPQPATPNETLSAMISDADRGMIRGKVQIISDERSNKLIIITRADNMQFFDKVIEVLDIQTAPDVRVKIIRLQHATAESGKDGEKGLVEILNELIGNASTTKTSSSKTSDKNKSTPYPGPGGTGNQNLTASTPATTPTPAATPAVSRTRELSADGKGKVGELSKENITILADKRINGLIVMASPTDLAVIEDIIKELDIELAQVLIETVLVQVQLKDEIKTGMDWVRGRTPPSEKSPLSPQYTSTGQYLGNIDSKTLALGSGGATASYAIIDGFNRTALDFYASKEDSNTKVLASPILMTVDNKEATLESTQMKYLYKGVRYSGSSYYGTEVPDYEQRDFGITIKITPRISPSGNVMLSVEEKFENEGPAQAIGSTDTNSASKPASYPTINTRKLQADVSVRNGQTIVLGGLVETTRKTSDTGIPILKDIPLIGRYLFGSTVDSDDRTELMVFITPYVLQDSDEAQEEARRRKDAMNMDGVWTKGWSNSELAEQENKQLMLQRERRKYREQEKEREAQEALQKLHEKEAEQAAKREARTPNTRKGPFIVSEGPVQVTEETTVQKPEPKKEEQAAEGLLTELNARKNPEPKKEENVPAQAGESTK